MQQSAADPFQALFITKASCAPLHLFLEPAETYLKDDLQKSNDPNLVYYSPSRVEILVQLIIAAIMLAMLVLPIYILFHLSHMLQGTNIIGPSIGVLVVFTLTFFGIFYLLTSTIAEISGVEIATDECTAARVQEVITATAAYVTALSGRNLANTDEKQIYRRPCRLHWQHKREPSEFLKNRPRRKAGVKSTINYFHYSGLWIAVSFREIIGRNDQKY